MSYIKLNSSNFFHNLDQISKKAGGKDKIFAVLKDNAYGHGLKEIASLSKKYGIKRVIVKDLNEAKEVSDLFEETLILSEIPKISLKRGISVTINNFDDLFHIPKYSDIHLKIDSGMHRNGIDIEQMENAFKVIKEKSFNLKGVMTHFRSADDLSSELFWQRKNWEEIKNKSIKLCKKYDLLIPSFHSCNSAALFRLKSCEDDFVRCGIAIYGYLETDEIFSTFELKPVLSLWAEKISSRLLRKGQRAGYGGVFRADESLIVSTYDIGYGDGFFRSDGTKELLTSSGKRVLGRVSMDNIICEGESKEIELFNNAKEVAKFFNTISYEITTKLSPFIKRIIV